MSIYYFINCWEFQTIYFDNFDSSLLPYLLPYPHTISRTSWQLLSFFNNLSSSICDAHIFTRMVSSIGLCLTYKDNSPKTLDLTSPKALGVHCSSWSTPPIGLILCKSFAGRQAHEYSDLSICRRYYFLQLSPNPGSFNLSATLPQ